MAQSARVPQSLQEHTVVDTDVHIRAPIDAVSRYLDNKFDANVKSGVKPTDSWNRYQGGKIDKINITSAEDIEVGLCKQFAVDYPIINPTVSYLNRLPQPDLAIALMRAYNDYLIDAFLDENDDFFGLMQLTTHDTDKAVEEIDRVGTEPQIKGIYFISLGSEAPLGDGRYDPIYAAADDHDLAIVYHSGTNAFITDFPRQYHAFNNFLPIHVLGHLWGQMQTLVSIIVEGTPEKFPDLNFVFLEVGISWLPALMFKLNKEISIRKDDAPLLQKQPEEYIREFYIGSQPLGEPLNRSHMQMMLEIIDAPRSLMFATDYPHWDFDNPSELYSYIRSMYDADEMNDILCGNAKKAFHLDI